VLYRLALRITLNHEEAQDIVQDTLIKVWNKRDDWQSLDNIEAFSMTICRNLALDALKKKGNNNESIEKEQIDTPDRASNPHELMIQKYRIEMVRRLVDQLPEKQRSCMQLRDFEGKAYKDIAQILGITEEQVKVNIFRARQTIKQQFSKADNYGL
jgi:RNA polymerase sigma-70 factor (ECF subfamily)